MKIRVVLAILALGGVFSHLEPGATADETIKTDERPALPFPPGVSVQSQCGDVDDLQNVETYDGSLGVSQEYVKDNELSTVQLQWLDEASIISRLPGYSPGNVARQRWCTGTLISEKLVLTAGHCFDPQSETGWITPFKIGSDGAPDYAKADVLAPLLIVNFGYQVDGVTGAIRVPTVFPIKSLLEFRRGSLDYALVELEIAEGNSLPAKVHPAEINLSAVPDQEVLGLIQHPQGEPKKIEAGKLLRTSANELFYNDIDTWGGSSGAGIRNSTGQIVGVHTNGGCESDANRGVSLEAIAAVSDQL
jgi:hypothetical protein